MRLLRTRVLRGYFLCVLVFILPACVYAEEITSFTSEIIVQPDSSIEVAETIVYDFGARDRHGIFRVIPTIHPQDARAWYLERTMAVEIIDVTRDGAQEPYVVSAQNGTIEIKIGDPDVTIEGAHTYTIGYVVEGALSFVDENTTELYWDVTGNGWQVPIHAVTAEIIDSTGTLLTDTRACYQGVYGGTGRCSLGAYTGERSVFTAVGLAPGEGVTIGQALTLDASAVTTLEHIPRFVLGVVFATLWLILLVMYMYRYVTFHWHHRTIIPQYEPYEGMRPMYSGLLVDGRLDQRDITAGLVYLAEQGFLKIAKTDKKVFFIFEVDDYVLTLLRPISEIESAFLKEVITLLFPLNTPTGSTISLEDLKKDQKKLQANAKTVQKLKASLGKDLKAQGFYEPRPLSLMLKAVASGVLVLIGGGLLLFAIRVDVVFVFMLAFAVITSVLAILITYRRRTRKGYEARNHLLGFKEFLSVTDTERFKFHNAPMKSPEQFMEYLPYAIAFGVEKEWAEVFKDITIPTPAWYDGGQAGVFNAVALTHSIDAFSSSLQSSGTSGSSGSGGGGFSGGGAGGGGGGSW